MTQECFLYYTAYPTFQGGHSVVPHLLLEVKALTMIPLGF